jgi:mannose-1-phosphate guanylyltransferase
VLVGGEGTRLRPLTDTTPKPLLPIGNVALLQRKVAWLALHGVDEVVLSLGYLPDAFAAAFPAGRVAGVALRYVVEDEPLGTAGAIRYAADEAGIGERFVVCNGDVLTTLDLAALVRFHDDRGAEATIHLVPVGDPSSLGVVPTWPSGEVMAFVEKPPAGRAPSNWINAGTYVVEPSVLERIAPGLTVSIEHQTFPSLLDERGRLFGFQRDDYWIDIGTPGKYLEANLDVLAGRLGTPPALRAIEGSPGVWSQGDVSVADGSHVEPPALLGPGTRVAPGARVGNSVLGPGCQVDEGARVERSVLLDGSRLAPEAAAVDAVMGYRAVLEAGALVTDGSVVGAGGVVAAGARLADARVDAGSPMSR